MIIGENTIVYPLTKLRGKILANKIVKDNNLIVRKEKKITSAVCEIIFFTILCHIL